MSPLSRRTALQSAGVSLIGALAGCSTLAENDQPTQVRFTEFGVNNFTRRPHTVQVLVQERGEPVYWNSMTADAVDLEGVTRAGGGDFEGYPTDPGEYDVYARHDEQPPGEWIEYESSSTTSSHAGDSDVICVRLFLFIGVPSKSEETFEPSPSSPFHFLTAYDCFE